MQDNTGSPPLLISQLLAERVPEIRLSVTWNQPKIGLEPCRTRLFFICFAKVLASLMNFTKSSNMMAKNLAKNEKKPYWNCLQFNPFLHGSTTGTLNPGFEYPFRTTNYREYLVSAETKTRYYIVATV